MLERVAMGLTGHKTRDVFERYNMVSPNDFREAADRLIVTLSVSAKAVTAGAPDAIKSNGVGPPDWLSFDYLPLVHEAPFCLRLLMNG